MPWFPAVLPRPSAPGGSRPARGPGRALLLSALLLLPGSAQDPLAPLKAHAEAHPQGRLAFTGDLAALRRGPLRHLPIGVFDSGIGGLTVLEALLSLDAVDNRTLKPGPDGIPDLAGERFIYLGDQANMPYGNYSAAGRTDLLRELILKDALFLLSHRYRTAAGRPPRFGKPAVKALVIACNTGTAYGLEDIRAALKGWGVDIPVIGVVDAGADAVAELLPAAGAPPSVGVLATVGTCDSGAYPAAIARAAARLGKTPPTVVQQGSVGLAGAIEGNPAFVTAAGAAARPVPYQGPAVDAGLARLGAIGPGHLLGGTLNTVEGYLRFDAASLMAAFRGQHPQAQPLGFVVLGCTHFPLVGEDFAGAFRRIREHREDDGAQPYAGRIAPGLTLVDPAEHTARALFRELAGRGLRRAPRARTRPAVAGFYMTVPDPAVPGTRLGAEGTLDGAYRLGRPLGRLEVEDTPVVTLTPRNLPASSRRLVQALPKVWRALGAQPSR